MFYNFIFLHSYFQAIMANLRLFEPITGQLFLSLSWALFQAYLLGNLLLAFLHKSGNQLHKPWAIIRLSTNGH